MPRTLSPHISLIVAVLAVSTAAPLIRLAPEVHPVAAGFWRVGIVAVLLSPGLRRGMPPVRYLVPTALAGLFLAAHFWTWFASLHQTTVLRSTLLVCLNPLWTGILEALILKQAPSRRYWAGLTLAFVGVAVMTTGPALDPSLYPEHLSGDLLALLGGILGSLYMLLGRFVRQRVDIERYGSLVCASAALWLAPLAVRLDVPLVGFSQSTWLALGALALGPQLLGHIGINYSLRYISAAVVSAALLLEPVGAAALGALLLNELPTTREVIGAVVVLAGVSVAVLRIRRTAAG